MRLSGFCTPGNVRWQHERCKLEGCLCGCHRLQDWLIQYADQEWDFFLHNERERVRGEVAK